MNVVLLIVLALSVGPILIAVGIRFLPLRGSVRLGGRASVLTLVAGLLPAIGAVLSLFTSWIPVIPLNPDLGWRAATPLALGVIAVLLLMVPAPRARARGAATLSRRRIAQFTPRQWIWTVVVLVCLVLGTTIAAGAASTRDEFGHYTMYWTSMGTSAFGTHIYGWHFSTPSLIVLAVLLSGVFAALFLITAAPWNDDIETDAAVRRLRATNILRVATGAVLIHLSVILQSLGGTAALRGESTTSELGTVAMGTAFAAFAPALTWTGIAAFVIGLTACFVTALTAIPARRVRATTRP